MSGNFFLYADVDLIFRNFHWRNTLFSWPGINVNNTLFSDSGWISVGVPLPQLTSLSPPSVNAGSGAVQITLSGTGFGTSPAVYWDGGPVGATTVSSSQLTIDVPATSLFDPGSHAVKVVNEDPLGGTSNQLPFQVLLPAPLLTQMSPGGATAEGPNFTLTVNGSWLVTGSTILWNSTPLPTTYISNSQLTAAVPASLVISAGSAQISVHQPSPYNQTSNPLTIPVFAAEPVLSGTRPFRAWPGTGDLVMHVLGTGFLPGSSVYWSGTPIETTYISGIQLDAKVPAYLLTQETLAAIDVINPVSAPSNSKPFTVAPTTYSMVKIPSLPGYTSVYPQALNLNGLVTGDDGSSFGRGFSWTAQEAP